MSQLASIPSNLAIFFNVFGRRFGSASLPVTAGCSGNTQPLGEVGLGQATRFACLGNTFMKTRHAPKVSFGFVALV